MDRSGDRDEIRVEPRPLPRLEEGAARLRSPVRVPWLRASLASAGIVGALAWFAPSPPVPPLPDAPVLPAPARPVAPPPAWLAVERPDPLFALSAPDLPEPVGFSAFRTPDGGARRDILTAGHPGGPAGHLRLVLSRSGVEPDRSAYLHLVRRAAEAGLGVVRMAQPGPLATKFGPMEAAIAVLAGEGERTCLTIRFRDPDLGFALNGWACGSWEPRQVACFLDRLTLAPGAGDPALKVLFAQAERRRLPGCTGPARPVVAGRQAP